jgi:hypothetical protein
MPAATPLVPLRQAIGSVVPHHTRIYTVHTGTAGTVGSARAAPLRPNPSARRHLPTSDCMPQTERGVSIVNRGSNRSPREDIALAMRSQLSANATARRGPQLQLELQKLDTLTSHFAHRTAPHHTTQGANLLIHELTRDRVLLRSLDELEDFRYDAASAVHSDLTMPPLPSGMPHARRPRYCERGRRDRETAWLCRPSPCVP